MNATVYRAGLSAGLTDRQAHFVAVYVESEGYRDTALVLGITEQTAKNLATRVRKRLGKPHISAVVAHLLT